MHLHARAPLDGDVELHLEHVRRLQPGVRRGEDVTARDVAHLDADQVDRDALARRGPLKRLIVDLDRPHPRVAGVRKDHQLIPPPDRPAPQGPCDDRPGAPDREHPIDVQPRRSGQVRSAV